MKSNYEWVSESWQANVGLIDVLNRIVERNVHVCRISYPATHEPTERMLTNAADSRQQIYRDATALLRDRQALFDGDPDALHALLAETTITPDDQARLFELYVLFRFISTLEDMQDTQPVFQTIQGGRQEIARIDGNQELTIYHDTSASGQGLSFRTEADPHRDLTRSEQVQQTARSVASDYFDTTFRDHTGRPDVIVLEIESDDPLTYEYLIAEIKHSSREETIREGIKQTLEYLAFLRVNEDYVFGRESENEAEVFGSGWNGLLVVQDLDEETPSVAEQASEPITIPQADELDDELRTVLENVLDSRCMNVEAESEE